ncbi:pheromone A receptor domain-containing protein [Trichoderma evansii]
MDSLFNLAPRGAPDIAMPGPPPDVFTSPSLMANLICRVVLALIGNIICLVPLRLLYRNGEFAAVIFIIVVEVQNFQNLVNALIWHNDDVASWWPGYGFCDIDSYIRNFGIGLYNTCLLAIMRNLAIQIGNMRASPLTKKEKKWRNIIQALIIFPLPLLQVAWTYPLTQQRYIVGTLSGCIWANSHSWPYMVFDTFLPAIVSFLTAGYAGKSKCRNTTNNQHDPATNNVCSLTSTTSTDILSSTVYIYIRYRQVSIATESALSNNPLAHARSQRARRRLYLMVVSILVPFFPIIVTLAIVNMRPTGALTPFDFDAIHHHGPDDIPWSTIIYLTSSELHWSYINMCYLPIGSTVPIFIFFGMTKDAMNCYRVVLLYLGLGKVLPRLYEEYDPDARILASISNGSHTTSTRSSKKGAAPSDLNFMTSIPSNQVSSTLQQPAPAATSLPVHNQDVHVQPTLRNPFLFRTRLDFSLPFKLSLFKLPRENTSSAPLELLSHQPTHRSVWSDEEPRLSAPYAAAATASTPRPTYPSNNTDKDHLAVAPVPPALLFPSAPNQLNGQGEL